MKITFSNNKLKKTANDPKRCFREYGQVGGKKLLQRLTDLRDAESMEDVRYLPGRYHELTEDRKGQWACDLQHPYRLIFKPHNDPIPTNDDGQYLWMEISGVEIIEIVDYH